MGKAILKSEADIQPLENVTIAFNPMMKRRAAEKEVVLDGDIPLVVDKDIVVALDAGSIEENREVVNGLADDEAAQVFHNTMQRLAGVLGIGGEGAKADYFDEDAALAFMLFLRFAGRLNDPSLPECRVTYDLTKPDSPASIEML
ncbi:MAG: hypothetical protein ACR2OR_06755 [Hyphomicrobiales bacterium]